MPILLLLITTALAALVGDAVVESVGAGGEDIVALGGILRLDVGTTATLTILTALSAGVALAWTAAVAVAVGRARERRLTEELEARWRERAQHNDGVDGRNKLLEFRVGELQAQLEDIAGKRDEILEEMAAVRARARELAIVAREQQATIASLTGEGDKVVRVPEAETEETVEAGSEDASADEPTEDERRARAGASEELHRLGF